MKSDFGSLARATLVVGSVLIATPLFAAAPGHRTVRPSSRPAAQTAPAASAAPTAPDDPQNATTGTAPTNAEPCHWWQFRPCDQPQQDSANDILPPEAPRTGPVIAVDLSTRTAYLFKDGRLLDKSPAAVGSGKVLVHGDDEWMFHTPEGHLKVLAKIANPIWHKPDWAFIEADQRIPPPGSPKRDVRGVMGKYALSLGEGIFIHGTDDPSSIGKAVSHGCIRLPDRMIDLVYHTARVGTDVYIFESNPPQQARGDAPEHHSDLDYLKKKN